MSRQQKVLEKMRWNHHELKNHLSLAAAFL